MKKLKISQLAPGFRYLQTLAFKCLTWYLQVNCIQCVSKKFKNPTGVKRMNTLVLWPTVCATRLLVNRGINLIYYIY